MPLAIARIIGALPMQADTIGKSYARVSRVGSQFYLKVSTDGEDVADEAARLRWFTGRAPVPRLVAFERDGAESYLLTEAVDGVAAHTLTDTRLDCVRALATGLHVLHRLDIDECPFDARLSVMMQKARDNTRAGRVDESDFDAPRLGRTAVELLSELEATQPHQEDLVVTHGDYCLPNVMLRDGAVAAFIDVGRAGVADRHQDFACAARSIAYNFGDAFVAPFFDAYGMVADPARIAFYQLLDEFF